MIADGGQTEEQVLRYHRGAKVRTCILVLGMHRSGTSALTRVLGYHGAVMPRTRMENRPDNVRGHWESEPLAAVHDEFLADLSSRWDDWRKLDPSRNDIAARRAGMAIATLIDDQFGGAELFALKDPRICRFVPFYRELLMQLGIRPVAVLPMRNPLTVMASLEVRNGMTPRHAALLWLRHVLEAERETRDLPRCILSYERLMKDWRAPMASIVARLRLTVPSPDEETCAQINGFLSKSLQHHEASLVELRRRRDLPEWIAPAYEAMLALEWDPDDEAALAKLDELAVAFEGATEPAASILFEEMSMRDRRIDLATSGESSKHSELQAAIAEAKSVGEELALARAQLNSSADANESVRSGLAHQIEQLRIDAAAREQELADARASSEHAARTYEIALNDLTRRVEQLQLEAAAREQELAETRASSENAARTHGIALSEITRQVEQLRLEAAAREQELAEARTGSEQASQAHGIALNELTRRVEQLQLEAAARDQELAEARAASEHAARTHEIALSEITRHVEQLRLEATAHEQELAAARTGSEHAAQAHGVALNDLTRRVEQLQLEVAAREQELVKARSSSEQAARTHEVMLSERFASEQELAAIQRLAKDVESQLEREKHERAQEVNSLTSTLSNRAKAYLEKLAEHVALQSRYASLTSSLDDARNQLGQISAERDGLAAQLVERQQQIAALEYCVRELRNSTSWRVTAPLRAGRIAVIGPRRNAASSYGRADAASSPIEDVPAAGIASVVTEPMPPPETGNGVSDQYELPELPVPPSDPTVSVIIPVYGQLRFTLQCLRSIAVNRPRVPFEVIVVDDASPDGSGGVLARVPGIRFYRNHSNLGFIGACNAGAQLAKGKFLHFLNNDTEVKPGWLDELVQTFDEFPGTGLVGSKLVFPDGKLQEAGGIIWQDGNAWNFGRGQDPTDPTFNYARQVDYCSGASILVPRALFLELGGFDDHYKPAYCEDSDLALKIRDRGLGVVYQPLSTVVHHEGMTSGTDTTKGVKAYQVENMRKQFERWKHRLASHEPSGTNVDSAKDRGLRRRILVLDHCTPTPDQDAGSLLTANTLLLLRQMGFQPTFIPEDNYAYIKGYTERLQRSGIEVRIAPHDRSVREHLMQLGARYDAALVFRPVAAERNFPLLKEFSPQARIIYHAVDLHYLRMRREAEVKQDARQLEAANKMRELEMAMMKAADAVVVPSREEVAIILQEMPGVQVYHVPLTMGVRKATPGFSSRVDIAFVGGFQHAPNVDAVCWFSREVMPKLRQMLPGVRLHIIGSKPTPEVLQLASHDVIVHGFVEDLLSIFDNIRLAVAPLRFGAGAKGKVATALSIGLPMVISTIAAEGMNLEDGRTALIADGAEAQAVAVSRLYGDEALWRQISQFGMAFAEETFGPGAACAALRNVLSNVGLSLPEQPRSLRLLGPDGHPLY